MGHTIHLAAELATTPNRVYRAYLNAKVHAAIIGGPVVIRARAGARFSAFGGMLSGIMLHLVPGKLIVQSWRSTGFKAGDPDSILILALSPVGRGKTLIDLTHVNVPAGDFAGISMGWEKYYWGPWREFLKPRSGKSVRQRRGEM